VVLARAGWHLALVAAGALPLSCSAADGPEAPRVRESPTESKVLPAFEHALDGFTVQLRATRFQRPAVRLPARVGEPFELTDGASGASIAVSLDDARLSGARGTLSEGSVIYPGRRGQVIHSVRSAGTEDQVALSGGEPVVRYRVDLGDGIAALRQVGSLVELLDAGGAPRFRVSAPWVADVRGAHHPVDLAIEGCGYDSDPRAPWGRKLVAPGARFCTLRMSWDGARVGFPAVLDPIWSLTGDMAYARYRFGLTLLNGGKVLAACGTNNVATELYDPATGTWAATGPMSSTLGTCSATHLADDRVLLVGGTTSRTYDPATGTWTNTASPAVGRSLHDAVLLSNGKAMVAGGSTSVSPYSTATAELFDPATNTWSSTGNMTTNRRDLTLTALPGGRVLAVSNPGAEAYSEATGTWSSLPAPPTIHYRHTAQPLPGGKVLLIGGSSSNKSDIFDSTTDTWTAGPDLAYQRWEGASVVLPNGHVVVTGGWDDNVGGEVEDAERYVPSLNKWILNGVLHYLRYIHRGVALPNGDAIFAGGNSVNIDYLDSVERLTLLADGAACQTEGECRSAFCVDGLCCDQACDGTCQTCRGSDKASGADGACGFVKSGIDPGSDCPDQGAASCGMNGSCDGGGACAKYPTGTACAAPSCQSGSLQTSACSSGGVCVQSSQGCAPYACADGISCATTCTLDEQCQSPASCDTSSGACVAPQANGASCSSDKQCTSGHCADGVCCDTACDGACVACSAQKKGGGTDGSCGNIAAGTDPDGDCPTDSPSTCQRDGMCSGTGTCRLYVAGTVCGATVCQGNAQVGSACDGTGTCSGSTSVDCGDYACSGSSCNTSCTTSADCAADAWCDAGSCKPRLTSGTACSSGDQCDTGFCVDGVCCQTPCTGQCAACDTSGALGLCVPVKGAPHGNREACPSGNGDVCAAKTCDGSDRESCNAFVGAEVECRTGSCTDGVATLSASCDGFGSCPVEQSNPCEPYACGTNACKSSCTAETDCAPGASCGANGQCVTGAICTGPTTSRNTQGVIEDCTPYACSAGSCRSACGSIQDCAPGYVCSSGGTCKAPASGSGDAGGCSLADAPTRDGSPWWLALAAVALAAVQRRRRDALAGR
jgi:MYXO-CTERM domain-containing protein